MTQPQSQKKLTEELLAELLDAPSIDGYVSGHDFPATTLSAYLQQLLDEKGLARSRVVRMADLNETFGYQIFTGARNPSRDKVLQIAFAMALTLRETNRALTAAGVSTSTARAAATPSSSSASTVAARCRRSTRNSIALARKLSASGAIMCPMDEHKTDIDTDFDAELASYLSSCEGAGSYRVLETLKSSDFEVTEKVVFCGRDGGELGPFVRKRIDAACGLGHAYERLMAAQRQGLRCPNLPRVLDCWNDGERLNALMEWLPGVTLEDCVREEGPSEELRARLRRSSPAPWGFSMEGWARAPR